MNRKNRRATEQSYSARSPGAFHSVPPHPAQHPMFQAQPHRQHSSAFAAASILPQQRPRSRDASSGLIVRVVTPERVEQAVKSHHLSSKESSLANLNLQRLFLECQAALAPSLGLQDASHFASQLLLDAASKGYPLCQYYIGRCFETGKGIGQNQAMCRHWFQQAAPVIPEAMYKLAQCLEDGWGGVRDPKEAFKLYNKSAMDGVAAASLKLAMIYENGVGVRIDLKAAFRLYMQAQILPGAQYHVGRCYDHGVGTTKDKPAAIIWYTKAKDGGYALAVNRLCDLQLPAGSSTSTNVLEDSKRKGKLMVGHDGPAEDPPKSAEAMPGPASQPAPQGVSNQQGVSTATAESSKPWKNPNARAFVPSASLIAKLRQTHDLGSKVDSGQSDLGRNAASHQSQAPASALPGTPTLLKVQPQLLQSDSRALSNKLGTPQAPQAPSESEIAAPAKSRDQPTARHRHESRSPAKPMMDHLKSAIRHMNPQMTSMSVLPAKSPAKPPAKSPAKSPSKPHNADKVRLQQATMVKDQHGAAPVNIAGIRSPPDKAQSEDDGKIMSYMPGAIPVAALQRNPSNAQRQPADTQPLQRDASARTEWTGGKAAWQLDPASATRKQGTAQLGHCQQQQTADYEQEAETLRQLKLTQDPESQLMAFAVAQLAELTQTASQSLAAVDPLKESMAESSGGLAAKPSPMAAAGPAPMALAEASQAPATGLKAELVPGLAHACASQPSRSPMAEPPQVTESPALHAAGLPQPPVAEPAQVLTAEPLDEPSLFPPAGRPQAPTAQSSLVPAHEPQVPATEPSQRLAVEPSEEPVVKPSKAPATVAEPSESLIVESTGPEPSGKPSQVLVAEQATSQLAGHSEAPATEPGLQLVAEPSCTPAAEPSEELIAEISHAPTAQSQASLAEASAEPAAALSHVPAAQPSPVRTAEPLAVLAAQPSRQVAAQTPQVLVGEHSQVSADTSHAPATEPSKLNPAESPPGPAGGPSVPTAAVPSVSTAVPLQMPTAEPSKVSAPQSSGLMTSEASGMAAAEHTDMPAPHTLRATIAESSEVPIAELSDVPAAVTQQQPQTAALAEPKASQVSAFSTVPQNVTASYSRTNTAGYKQEAERPLSGPAGEAYLSSLSTAKQAADGAELSSPRAFQEAASEADMLPLCAAQEDDDKADWAPSSTAQDAAGPAPSLKAGQVQESPSVLLPPHQPFTRSARDEISKEAADVSAPSPSTADLLSVMPSLDKGCLCAARDGVAEEAAGAPASSLDIDAANNLPSFPPAAVKPSIAVAGQDLRSFPPPTDKPSVTLIGHNLSSFLPPADTPSLTDIGQTLQALLPPADTPSTSAATTAGSLPLWSTSDRWQDFLPPSDKPPTDAARNEVAREAADFTALWSNEKSGQESPSLLPSTETSSISTAADEVAEAAASEAAAPTADPSQGFMSWLPPGDKSSISAAREAIAQEAADSQALWSDGDSAEEVMLSPLPADDKPSASTAEAEVGVEHARGPARSSSSSGQVLQAASVKQSQADPQSPGRPPKPHSTTAWPPAAPHQLSGAASKPPLSPKRPPLPSSTLPQPPAALHQSASIKGEPSQSPSRPHKPYNILLHAPAAPFQAPNIVQQPAQPEAHHQGVNQGGLPSFQALQLDAEAILLNALPELSPGLRQAPSAAFRIPPKPHNPSTGPYNDKDIPWPDGPIPDVVRPGQAREAFLAVHDGNPQDHRAILARLLATTQSQNI